MDSSIKELLSKLAQGKPWEDPLVGTISPSEILSIEECFPAQKCVTPAGEHLIIQELCICEPLPTAITIPETKTTAPLESFSQDWVFLDIESTGSSSEPLFLVGLLFPSESGAKTVLHLARHYEEEASVLTGTINDLAQKCVLVTFNGKSYDVPVIRDRSRLHHVQSLGDIFHLDLLHLSRKVFPKGTTSNYKLKTLEAEILGRNRFGDVESSDIPRIYHHYVHHQDARELALVVKHNILDLWAMYDLVRHILNQNSRL